jgi:hypothetical protein
MKWQAVAGCGKRWQAVASCGRLWQAVAGRGRPWQAVAGRGRPWQAVAGCARLWSVVPGCGRPWQAVAGRGKPWQAVAGFWQAVAGRGRPWQTVAGCTGLWQAVRSPTSTGTGRRMAEKHLFAFSTIVVNSIKHVSSSSMHWLNLLEASSDCQHSRTGAYTSLTIAIQCVGCWPFCWYYEERILAR